LPNVFVIGKGADSSECSITLPKGDGIKLDIFQQRDGGKSA
jgi:hypothetical protein